ncbi:MAG: glycosyltransferase family 39 protein [Desulfobacterales bacterium]|nr:glycosyltransferase family 39 protein [Desulfobacterales bacterium]
MNPSDLSFKDPLSDWNVSRTAALIIFLGFVLRLYSFLHHPLINPDGTLYIQQAKALYFGLWDSVLNCYPYLSNYPIFIAIGYKIFGNWVLSAQSVSLFFGTLTLLPIYWMLRRFFNETVSCLVLLIFGVLPSFVQLSHDVLRGPVYWFFSMLGLYLFILQLEKKNKLFGLFSSLCFMMGAWARIEGFLFILVSIIYLILSRQDKKWQQTFFFLLPFIVFSFFSIFYVVFSAHDILTLLKPERILSRGVEFLSRYQDLRQNLEALADQNPIGFSPFFLPRVRNLIWLIALGTVCVQIVETLFYFFFIVLILGIVQWIRQIPKDSRLIYLSLLSISALIVLYFQVIYNWAMASRFVYLFLFPALIFMGAGLEKIANFLNRHFQLKKMSSYALICLAVLIIALPKTIRAHWAEDKLVFKEIGEFIADRENNKRAVSVAGAFKRVRCIHFYANLNYPGAPCFETSMVIKNTDSEAFEWIIALGVNYFVWDAKSWHKEGLNQFLKHPDQVFMKVKEWNSSRRGRLILYEIKA